MLPDQQVAELVTRDRIDILVDLDMHSPGNHLLVLAPKPAPVQVSGLAYPGTTGMLAVDYRVTNSPLEADGSEEQFYSERTIRLPDAGFCYTAPSPDSPAIEPPAQRNGFVTYGYLGDFFRITSRTIDLWARALSDMERSRLLLAAPRGSCRQRLIDAFARLGISQDRIEFADAKACPGNLGLYRRIDVALDTFPWNGRTATLDAIWMAAPVVTLHGERGVSRIGSAILSRVGLEHLIARSPDEFATIAARLAGDLSELAALRSSLRRRLESSPLMDAAGFTRNLESAYRQIWTTWCSTQGRQGLVTAWSLGARLFRDKK
jgi:predicted O-linked N-acetylglucosamine transferase (SPINDLY family)